MSFFVWCFFFLSWDCSLLLSLSFSLVLLLDILLLLLLFYGFVFVVFSLSFPLDYELDVDFSLLVFSVSSRQLPVLPSKFKCLMFWRRLFSIAFSFDLTIPFSYSFMVACFTYGSSLISWFVTSIDSAVSLCLKAIAISCAIILPYFFCWYLS